MMDRELSIDLLNQAHAQHGNPKTTNRWLPFTAIDPRSGESSDLEIFHSNIKNTKPRVRKKTSRENFYHLFRLNSKGCLQNEGITEFNV